MVSNQSIASSTHSNVSSLRAVQKHQQPFVLWLTGLSGAGKSTLAEALELTLISLDMHTYLLDGDVVRRGLNQDLGFSDADRHENLRRTGEVATMLVDAGLVVLAAFISPFIEERSLLRGMFKSGQFIEIYVATPLEVCEQRDVKGLYRRARAGSLTNFTGIDSAYQPPISPELTIDTSLLSVEQCVEQIIVWLRLNGHIPLASV